MGFDAERSATHRIAQWPNTDVIGSLAYVPAIREGLARALQAAYAAGVADALSKMGGQGE